MSGHNHSLFMKGIDSRYYLGDALTLSKELVVENMPGEIGEPFMKGDSIAAIAEIS